MNSMNFERLSIVEFCDKVYRSDINEVCFWSENQEKYTTSCNITARLTFTDLTCGSSMHTLILRNGGDIMYIDNVKFIDVEMSGVGKMWFCYVHCKKQMCDNDEVYTLVTA